MRTSDIRELFASERGGDCGLPSTGGGRKEIREDGESQSSSGSFGSTQYRASLPACF